MKEADARLLNSCGFSSGTRWQGSCESVHQRISESRSRITRERQGDHSVSAASQHLKNAGLDGPLSLCTPGGGEVNKVRVAKLRNNRLSGNGDITLISSDLERGQASPA